MFGFGFTFVFVKLVVQNNWCVLKQVVSGLEKALINTVDDNWAVFVIILHTPIL